MKKNIILLFLFIFTFSSLNADFMYEEIDPICSISWTTHTSFPWEISDTSAWYIPKAYDWECIEVPVLNSKEKNIITDRVIKIFDDRGFIERKISNWYSLNSKWEKFAQDIFFTIVKDYISEEISKTNPNKKVISILNYAVSIVWYDYYLKAEVENDDYVWLSLQEAKDFAKENNTVLRVVKLDGENLPVTMDYRPGRINAEVENNIVVDYSVE